MKKRVLYIEDNPNNRRRGARRDHLRSFRYLAFGPFPGYVRRDRGRLVECSEFPSVPEGRLGFPEGGQQAQSCGYYRLCRDGGNHVQDRRSDGEEAGDLRLPSVGKQVLILKFSHCGLEFRRGIVMTTQVEQAVHHDPLELVL